MKLPRRKWYKQSFSCHNLPDYINKWWRLHNTLHLSAIRWVIISKSSLYVAYANPTVLTCPWLTKTMFTYLILVINWVISSAASARKRSEFLVSRDNLQTKWRIYRPVNSKSGFPSHGQSVLKRFRSKLDESNIRIFNDWKRNLEFYLARLSQFQWLMALQMNFKKSRIKND